MLLRTTRRSFATSTTPTTECSTRFVQMFSFRLTQSAVGQEVTTECCLTHSLPRHRLKTTNKGAKFEILQAPTTPFLFFHISMWKDFHRNAQYRKQTYYRTGIYLECLQACAFALVNTENYTGCVSEGVNVQITKLPLVGWLKFFKLNLNW